MPGRSAFHPPLSRQRPPVTACHLRGHAALVQKHQLPRIDPAYLVPPRLSPLPAFCRVVLGGVERFFLSRHPIRTSTRQSWERLSRIRCAFQSLWRNSAKVASGCACTSACNSAAAGRRHPAERTITRLPNAGHLSRPQLLLVNLLGVGQADVKPLRQFPQRHSAPCVRLQNLAPQIVRIRSCHRDMSRENSPPAAYDTFSFRHIPFREPL